MYLYILYISPHIHCISSNREKDRKKVQKEKLLTKNESNNELADKFSVQKNGSTLGEAIGKVKYKNLVQKSEPQF